MSFPVSTQVTVPVAHVHIDERFASRGGEQQRPILCHRAPLHHAPLRHHLHRCLQVEDEQAAGLHHVPPLHRLPGGQRHAGGEDHLLPGFHLTPEHPLTQSSKAPFRRSSAPFSSKQEL